MKIPSRKRASTVCVAFIAWTIMFIGTSVAQEEIAPIGRRIIGGKETEIRNHPWQVGLLIIVDGKVKFCGGSLVGEKWVLTAGHCFERNTLPGSVKVKAGVNSITSGNPLTVKRIIVHEGFSSTTYQHDIALLELSSASKEGKVIPLDPATKKIPVGQELEVTGWGVGYGNLSPKLLRATVAYVDTTLCNAPEAYNNTIKPDMLCAGFEGGGTDSCQGDSGGPLVWRRPDGDILVGIVSGGEDCAQKLKYGIYTRVSAYREWIKQITSK